jgi:hypothetical protein
MARHDDGTFSIRLVHGKNGRPASNRKVTVFYGGGSETRYTDDDGWSSFPTLGYSYVGQIYSVEYYGILVLSRGVLLSKGERISDGATFSFAVNDG